MCVCVHTCRQQTKTTTLMTLLVYQLLLLCSLFEKDGFLFAGLVFE